MSGKNNPITPELPVPVQTAPQAGESQEQHPDRPGASEENLKRLWCPFAERVEGMVSRGKYDQNYPEGAIVHFTSGSSASSSISWGREQGYLFWMIARDGTVYQPNPLDEWGYHAGESSYPGIGKGVSKRLVGIEMDNGSALTKRGDNYYTWFNRKVDIASVRISNKEQNIAAGVYEKYTPEQERALGAVLLWMKRNNPNVFKLEWVLGHDEVSPGRKNDPGGALSSTMPLFRLKLINEYKS